MNQNFKPLEDIFKNRISTDNFEREFYTSDLAAVPSLISALLKTKPDLVVKPETCEEISEILHYANGNKIPVTLRAAATTGLGNVIPTRGGIVIDMSLMNKKIEINESNKTVSVSAGVIWRNLERTLNRRNFSLMTYPSSTPSATVGGWLASPGYGLGTLKYGKVHDQVTSMKVVLPDGNIKSYSEKGQMECFMGSDGVMGIICETELKIRELPEKESLHLVTCKDCATFCNLIQAIMELGPFNISYANKKFLEMMEKAKNTNFINFQHDFEYRSLIVFDGNENEVSSVETRFKEKIKNIAGITENTREECEEEWKDRFNPMRIKRRGPTLLAGDLLIPLNQLKSAIDELNKLDMNVGIEGNIAAKDKAIIMPMYLADERNAVDFLFALRHLKKINDIAVSAGGIPYGIGLWNTPYIKKIMGVAELKRKKEMKKKLDPNHILNPDKHLGIGLILPGLVFNSKIYALSMFGLRILSKPFRWLKIIKS